MPYPKAGSLEGGVIGDVRITRSGPRRWSYARTAERKSCLTGCAWLVEPTVACKFSRSRAVDLESHVWTESRLKRSDMTKVFLREGESQEHLLRRFRKQVTRDRILSDVKKKRFFVSNSEKRRLALRKARRRERRRKWRMERRRRY